MGESKDSKSAGAAGKGCAILLAMVVIISVVVWCSAPNKKPVDPYAKPPLDASAQLACRDFSRLVRDMDAGVMTNDEIREAAKKIRANTKLSDSLPIRSAGDELLRSMTTGNVAEAQTAIRAMTKACMQK